MFPSKTATAFAFILVFSKIDTGRIMLTWIFVFTFLDNTITAFSAKSRSTATLESTFGVNTCSTVHTRIIVTSLVFFLYEVGICTLKGPESKWFIANKAV